MDMLSDIVNYFMGSADYKTMQAKIGVSNLFKEFIIKDWYGESKTNQYFRLNRILAKESILFYQ